MSRFDGFYENLVNQGVDPQTAYMQVRLKTANHPWFPSKLALANTGNPALIRYDPGCDAQGRSSPNGVAFGPILNNIPGRSVPYDGLFGPQPGSDRKPASNIIGNCGRLCFWTGVSRDLLMVKIHHTKMFHSRRESVLFLLLLHYVQSLFINIIIISTLLRTSEYSRSMEKPR